MKLLIIVLSMFSQQEPTHLTDTLPLKHRTYKTTVFNNGAQSNFGYLTEIRDSTLLLSPIAVTFDPIFSDNKNIKSFNYGEISMVKIRRTGTTGRAILIGTITGFTAGAIAGLIEGDDPPEYWFGMTAGEKAITYGALGSVTGVVIGAIIGAVAKKKFIIGGKKEKFDAMRMNVLQKAYGKQRSQ